MLILGIIIPMTLAQAHRQAAQELISSGEYSREEAHLAARLLLDSITSTRHAHLTRGDETFESALDTDSLTRFSTALEELKTGRPLAYVLGTREFFGLQFRCDERALIPRPETELLIETALCKLSTTASISSSVIPHSAKIADMGTGTGCIAVTLAGQFPNAQIFATDLSPDALNLARANASTHGVAEVSNGGRIRFLAGKQNDWAAPLREFSDFDLILSNPPYIAAREIETLQTQIKNFEPRAALDGGDDGLNCYRQIAAQCRVLLKPTGALLLELGAGQFEEVRAIFEAHKWRVEKPVLDFASIERVLVARRAD